MSEMASGESAVGRDRADTVPSETTGTAGSADSTGGIVPDVPVEMAPADTLLDALVADGVLDEFLAARPPQASLDLSCPLPADYIQQLVRFAAADLPGTIEAIDGARLERALRYEIAYRRLGEGGALRVSLEGDTPYWEAVASIRAGGEHVATTQNPPSAP